MSTPLRSFYCPPASSFPIRMCAHGTKPAFCRVLRDAIFVVLHRAQGMLPSSWHTRFNS